PRAARASSTVACGSGPSEVRDRMRGPESHPGCTHEDHRSGSRAGEPTQKPTGASPPGTPLLVCALIGRRIRPPPSHGALLDPRVAPTRELAVDLHRDAEVRGR